MTIRSRMVRVKEFYPWLNSIKEVDILYSKGKDPYVIDMRMTGTTPGVNDVEIDAPDADFDGEATPITISIKSDAAGDTDDVYIMGWAYDATHLDAYGKSQPDYLATDTITATGVTQADGTITFKRIFHAFTDPAATGNITIVDTATGLTTYLTISATKNESNGARIYVPDGMRMARIDGDACMTTMTGATTNNITLTEVFTNGWGGDELLISPHTITAYNAKIVTNPSLIVLYDKILMAPKHRHVGAANNWYWHLPYILWSE